jgi:hypothetical protein
MVEGYWQGKTPDLSTRALWQSYQQSYLVAKHEELSKEIRILSMKYFFHTSKGPLTCRKILQFEANNGFTSPLKEGMLWISLPLKIIALSWV